MAVSVTVAQLAVQLRITTAETDSIDAGQQAVLTRALETAVAEVEHYAPAAPGSVQDEAAIRIAGWLYDRSPAETRGGNPLVQSGAAHLLSRWRTRAVATPSGSAATATLGCTSSERHACEPFSDWTSFQSVLRRTARKTSLSLTRWSPRPSTGRPASPTRP